MTNLVTISFSIFNQVQGVVCAFSTRKAEGAISAGPFAQLNLGNHKFDKKENIEYNRSLFFKHHHVEPQTVVFPGQIHSANIRFVNQPGIYPDTDALVTDKRNLFLTVQTADCFPVFLVEPQKRVIALIHAGWRGLVQDIVRHTIELMTTNLAVNPQMILAAIGPGLQAECFEVNADVYQKFPEKFRFSHRENSKRYIDLSGFIKEELMTYGVRNDFIEVSDQCSMCREDLFFSYRRDGEKSGRMMGILGICG
jgi:YfiH family protein